MRCWFARSSQVVADAACANAQQAAQPWSGFVTCQGALQWPQQQHARSRFGVGTAAAQLRQHSSLLSRVRAFCCGLKLDCFTVPARQGKTARPTAAAAPLSILRRGREHTCKSRTTAQLRASSTATSRVYSATGDADTRRLVGHQVLPLGTVHNPTHLPHEQLQGLLRPWLAHWRVVWPVHSHPESLPPRSQPKSKAQLPQRLLPASPDLFLPRFGARDSSRQASKRATTDRSWSSFCLGVLASSRRTGVWMRVRTDENFDAQNAHFFSPTRAAQLHSPVRPA